MLKFFEIAEFCIDKEFSKKWEANSFTNITSLSVHLLISWAACFQLAKNVFSDLVFWKLIPFTKPFAILIFIKYSKRCPDFKKSTRRCKDTSTQKRIHVVELNYLFSDSNENYDVNCQKKHINALVQIRSHQIEIHKPEFFLSIKKNVFSEDFCFFQSSKQFHSVEVI